MSPVTSQNTGKHYTLHHEQTGAASKQKKAMHPLKRIKDTKIRKITVFILQASVIRTSYIEMEQQIQGEENKTNKKNP